MIPPRRLAPVFAFVLIGCHMAQRTLDVSSESGRVRDAMARGTRALERHDWPAYADYWANDPDISVVHPSGREWVDGWDAISRKYRTFIADTTTTFHAKSLRQDVHVSPSGEMAWVTQQDSLFFTARGRTTGILQWSTAVFEKRHGQWKLVHAHASQLPTTNRP